MPGLRPQNSGDPPGELRTLFVSSSLAGVSPDFSSVDSATAILEYMTRWMATFLLLTTPAAPQEMKLARVVELKGTTYHVQGVDFDNRRAWVTSVDTPHQRGSLHE